MHRSDFQILCSALGFLTALIVGHGKNADKERAVRADDMATLIEAYCRASHPELFPTRNATDLAEIDHLIEEMKEDDLHTGQLSSLTDNKELLLKVYDRLVQRYKAYATDAMIVGEIAHFIEEENNHKAEADMMIVNVQGDEDFLAPAKDMATAIAEILTKNGDCYPEDLKARGFSPEEIKRHWPMAYALAKVELNWLDA